MLLLFVKDTYNYFAVDNMTGKVNFVSGAAVSTLHRFSHYFGGIERLDFRTKEDMDIFRKQLKKLPLKDVPIIDTKQYLQDNFPEYFI